MPIRQSDKLHRRSSCHTVAVYCTRSSAPESPILYAHFINRIVEPTEGSRSALGTLSVPHDEAGQTKLLQ